MDEKEPENVNPDLEQTHQETPKNKKGLIITIVVISFLFIGVAFAGLYYFLTSQVANNSTNNIDDMNNIEEREEDSNISGQIVVKDYLGNPLTDFPINIGNEIYVTNEIGIINLDLEKGNPTYLQSGNADWKILDEFCESLESFDCRSSFYEFEGAEIGLGHKIVFNENGERKNIRMLVTIPRISYFNYLVKSTYEQSVVTGPYLDGELNFSFTPPQDWNITFINNNDRKLNRHDYFDDKTNYKIIYSSPYTPQDEIIVEAVHGNFFDTDTILNCSEFGKVDGLHLIDTSIVDDALEFNKNCLKTKNSYILFHYNKNSQQEVEDNYKKLLDSVMYYSGDYDFGGTIRLSPPTKGVELLVMNVSESGYDYNIRTFITNENGEIFVGVDYDKNYYVRTYEDYYQKIDDEFCETFNDYDCRFNTINFPDVDYTATDLPWGHKIIFEGTDDIKELKLKPFSINNGIYFNKSVYENL